jgi:hypothetical protein
MAHRDRTCVGVGGAMDDVVAQWNTGLIHASV